MSLISREGTYRADGITDSGISLTTNGFPQFVASIKATQCYDFDEKQWVDWSGEDEETIAYFVLFGGNGKPTLSAKNIQKALGWSGQSFEELNDTDYSEVPFQFRVEEHEYEGNVTLQVNWITEYDAVPGRQVQKLEGDAVKKLDKLFAQQLKNFGGVKIASAPAGAPEIPAESNVAGTDAIEPETADETPQAEPEMPAKSTKAKPKTAKKTSATSESTATKSEVWRYINELAEDATSKTSLEQRASLFTDAIQKIAPDAKKKSDVTPEQWFLIREECAIKILKF